MELASFVSRRSVLWALCVLAVLFAVGTRFEYGVKNGISHDEIISLKAAQGNDSRFVEEAPDLAGKWVPAGAWKAFIVTPAPLSLSEIASDLAKRDTHPPLYFWLLRFWTDQFGIQHIRLMNVPFLLLACAALFFLARRGVSPAGALLAVAIFLLAPAAIRVSALARPYELLGLISLVLALQTQRMLDERSRWLDPALFAVAALVGMLTQYVTALVIFTGMFLILVHRKQVLLRLVPCLVGSAAAFCLLHPHFYEQLGNSEKWLGIAERLPIAAQTVLSFFGWRESWSPPYLDVAVVLALCALAVFCLVRVRKMPLPVVFAILPVTAAMLLYLALLTPSQGFGGRHLSVATPFAVLCIAMAVERFAPRLLPVLLVAACLIAAPVEFALSTLRPKYTSPLSTAPQIVTNNLSGGIILRYALEARDDARIFAARDLLAKHDWAETLGPDGIIILNPQYQDPQKFGLMKETIEKDFPAVAGEWGETLHKRPAPR